jgi:uncharacterized protein
MFNSLGNLAVDPTAAVLFIDFNAGRMLQLTGQAELLWAGRRRVQFTLDRLTARPAPVHEG